MGIARDRFWPLVLWVAASTIVDGRPDFTPYSNYRLFILNGHDDCHDIHGYVHRPTRKDLASINEQNEILLMQECAHSSGRFEVMSWVT